MSLAKPSLRPRELDEIMFITDLLVSHSVHLVKTFLLHPLTRMQDAEKLKLNQPPQPPLPKPAKQTSNANTKSSASQPQQSRSEMGGIV